MIRRYTRNWDTSLMVPTIDLKKFGRVRPEALRRVCEDTPDLLGRSLEDILYRMASNVVEDETAGCFNWVGQLWPGKSYGRLTGARTHRISWLIFKGEIPEDKPFVCHRCDNPPCCNPKHLFVGDNSQNQKDAVAKGVFEAVWTPERRMLWSEKYSGKNNPMYGRSGENAPCYGRIGELHPMFGKHHTRATKDKISAGMRLAIAEGRR